MAEVISLPEMFRPAEIRAASFDESQHTIDVVWTTGAVVRRVSWFDGEFDEELVVEDGAVRLERMNLGAPFLDSHDAYGLRSVLGSVVPGSARLNGGKGIAKVTLTKRADAEGVVQDIRDGIIRNISVGYRIFAIERTERDGQVPLDRVVDWEPLEVSAVAVPADAAAQIRSDKRQDTFACRVSTHPSSKETALRRLRMQMRARQSELAG